MKTLFTTNNTTNNTNTINNSNNTNANAPCTLHADNKPYEFGLRATDYYRSVVDPVTGVIRFNRTNDVRVLERAYLDMKLHESVELKNSTIISYKCAVDSAEQRSYNQKLDEYVGLLKGSSYYMDGYAGNGKTTAIKWLLRSLTHKDGNGNPKAEKIYYICVGEREDEYGAMRQILINGDYGYGFYSKYIELDYIDDNRGMPLEEFAQAMYNAMEDVLEGQDVIMIVDSASRVAIQANEFPCPGEAIAPGGLYPSALRWIGKLFKNAVKRMQHPVQKGSMTVIGTILKKEDDRQSVILTDTAESKSNGHISIGFSKDPEKYVDTVTGVQVPTNINLAESYTRAFKRYGVPSGMSDIEYLTQILK